MLEQRTVARWQWRVDVGCFDMGKQGSVTNTARVDGTATVLWEGFLQPAVTEPHPCDLLRGCPINRPSPRRERCRTGYKNTACWSMGPLPNLDPSMLAEIQTCDKSRAILLIFGWWMCQ